MSRTWCEENRRSKYIRTPRICIGSTNRCLDWDACCFHPLCQSLGIPRQALTIRQIHADLLDAQIGPNTIPKMLSGLECKTIDILVNNAAVVDMTLLQPFEHITVDAFGKGFQGHVFGVISLTNAVMQYFPPRGGRVINISSVASKIANDDPMMIYGATKAAVDSITRSLAAAYGISKGATFNSVSVGATLTDAMKTVIDMVGPTVEEGFKAEITADARLGQPEDIAFIVGFLASEEGRWVNGANVSASGGHKSLLGLQG